MLVKVAWMSTSKSVAKQPSHCRENPAERDPNASKACDKTLRQIESNPVGLYGRIGHGHTLDTELTNRDRLLRLPSPNGRGRLTLSLPA